MPHLHEPLGLVFFRTPKSSSPKVVDYLREENRILRSKLPKRLPLTARENNRLIKYSSLLGPAINGFNSIRSFQSQSPCPSLQPTDRDGRSMMF